MGKTQISLGVGFMDEVPFNAPSVNLTEIARRLFENERIRAEVSPPGWEDTVKSMKKHKNIKNPWALAYWMKGKGAKPSENITMEQLDEVIQHYLSEDHVPEEILACDPMVKKIQKENPPKVEDKTEKGNLPQHKKMATPGAPKSNDKEPKYTDLSNYVPAEIKRDAKDEVPTIDLDFDEDFMEEEEADEDFDPQHMAGFLEEKFQRYGGPYQKAGKSPRDPDYQKMKAAKPGTTWDTDSGSVGAMSPDRRVRYFTKEKRAEASEWARTGKLDRESKPQTETTIIKPEDKEKYSKDTFKQGSEAAKRLAKKDPNWKPASHPDYRKSK